MNRVAILAGVACTVLLPTLARAQPLQGPYVGFGIGPNMAGNLLSSHETTKIYTNVGPVTAVDLGWGLGNGLRAEIEGSYRSNSVGGISTRRVNGQLLPLANPVGTAGQYAAMVNLDYDIPYRPFGFQPYVGAGIGYTWLDLEGTHGFSYGIIRAPGNNIVIGPDEVTFGNAGGLAYQAIAGVSMDVPKVPGLQATLEYRYFGSARINTPVNRTVFQMVNGTYASAGTHNGFFAHDNAVLIGLRYAFGHAPPPPAPADEAPPPAPVAKSYLVFFDWDKATLTDRARQIVAEAAENAKKVQLTRIEVNGYTDTSGTPKYNMGLSVRRAEAVAAELVRDGVPRQEISMQGFGDTHLLVPTGPGVREPQNRRVEIILG